MNGAFYIGATGLHAQEHALDVVANNISNINTTAFKRSAVRFSDLVMPLRDDVGQAQRRFDRTGELAGVSVGATPRVWTQGDLKQTGRSLDLAIDGAGLVEVLGPSGRTLLWRGGQLKVNGDGYLATADGLPLRAMISVPRDATDVTIDREGVVAITTDGGDGSERIGQLELVLARDENDLVGAANGYYEAADGADLVSVAAGDEGGGVFVQRALEGANVELSDEMVTLLLMQRSFSANAQVVQAGDQLMSIVNGLRR